MKVFCAFCSFDYHSPTKELTCPSCGTGNPKHFIFSEDVSPVVPESEMMYEVLYHYRYADNRLVEETVQCTRTRVDYYRSRPDYYQDLKVVRELGLQNTTWLSTWYQIALKNPYVAQSYDPKFSIESFAECKSLDYLMNQLIKGNWSVGTAFYYRNLTFINQVDGGDEWLVIKEGLAFESWSCGYVLNKYGKDYFACCIYQMLQAKTSQLQELKYGEVTIPDSFQFDGVTYLNKAAS